MVKKGAKKTEKAKKAKEAKKEKKTRLGKVTHFFDKISVAVIKIEKPIAVGDEISIEGSTTNFRQKVSSMQIDMKPIEKAKKGQEIGMKTKDKAREGDIVFKA